MGAGGQRSIWKVEEKSNAHSGVLGKAKTIRSLEDHI